MTTEPPRHNDEYEKAIINQMLSPTFTGRDTMANAVRILKPEYFYNQAYRDSYRAVLDMLNGTYGVPVPEPDIMTFTQHIQTNADRYDTFRAMRERNPQELIGFALDFDGMLTGNGCHIVSEIIEMYKARRRYELGVQLQNISGEIGDTEKERQKIYDQLAALEMMDNDRYADFFTPSTLAGTMAALRNQGAGLSTGYTLGKEQRGQILKREFTIPPKQITVIAAATGHGKSTFCYNLALRLIARNKRPDGNPVKVVYLSYEESAHNIDPKIINVLCGLNLAEDNRAAIANDLSNGGTGAFINNPTLKAQYTAAVKQYYDMAAAGTLTVKYCDLDAAELCALIRNMKKRDAADVVIIDYVQLQEKESSKAHGRNRPDELKEICADLRKLANDNDFGLPVIVASQFNREVQKSNDPRTMDKTNIGESANIEHVANVILGLWNCQETKRESYYNADGKLTADGERLVKYQHTKDIDDPFIYARLLKSRDGINGLNMTLNYYGNCGRIDNTTDTTPNERAGYDRDERTEPHNTLTPAISQGKPAPAAAPADGDDSGEQQSVMQELPF